VAARNSPRQTISPQPAGAAAPIWRSSGHAVDSDRSLFRTRRHHGKSRDVASRAVLRPLIFAFDLPGNGTDSEKGRGLFCADGTGKDGNGSAL
jgi:hypothetical protein